jgi:molybdopterin/thiamine biosynthesis adenylyltransferase
MFRAESSNFSKLRELVFRRYPDYEWATFARFGWRQTPSGLVLTMAQLMPPDAGELDESVGHVAIREPYTLRVALDAEQHPLAPGVIHSHPRNCPPEASPIDDDMDAYYASYFETFAPNRPYVSLILAEMGDIIALGGRTFWQGQWCQIRRVAVDRIPVRAWHARSDQRESTLVDRRQRLVAAFGIDAAQKLRRSTVAVIGVGGTGSAAVEVLARAGVGRLILVDPDRFEASNLERVHGSVPGDAATNRAKVVVARDHVAAIDPEIQVEALLGSMPQEDVLDAVVSADALLGCTDQQHSRLAMSDTARRYLIPALDCGVVLEGRGGVVSAQVIQFVRFLPDDPCPLCRRMIIPEQLAQELMDPDERRRRISAARTAMEHGQEGGAYWRDQPQLNTVGYLTTTAGALAAGYVIGWLTGRFMPPFTRLQMNLVAPFLDVTDVDDAPRVDCACRTGLGWADQGAAGALVTSPWHWPKTESL